MADMKFNARRFLIHMFYNFSSHVIWGPLTGLVAWVFSSKYLAANAAHLPRCGFLFIGPFMMYVNFVAATVFLVLNRRNETDSGQFFDLAPYVFYLVSVIIRVTIIGIRYATVTNKEYNSLHTTYWSNEEIDQ